MEKVVTMNHLAKIYKDKKVFITGHTGFKGSWLVACLHLFGAKLKGYALTPEHPYGLYSLMQPLHLIESIYGDIRDKEKLKEAILSFQPDYIFHMAAQPLVRKSYDQPIETFEVNALGTANLLEVVNQLKGKCSVVIITTDKVYENKEKDLLYKETDELGGYDPYSASKACTEIITASFRSSFFNSTNIAKHQKGIASARAGNVIGGGDFSKDRIIPDMIKALQSNQVIEVRNPLAVRPWQHVLEPLGGYLLLGSLLNDDPIKFSQAYNFGPIPNDHLSVKVLVSEAIKSWGKGEWIDKSNAQNPHEAGLLKLDISKAKNELYWTPKLTAAQAIDWTIELYKTENENSIAFSFKQIENYMQL